MSVIEGDRFFHVPKDKKNPKTSLYMKFRREGNIMEILEINDRIRLSIDLGESQYREFNIHKIIKELC